MNYEFNLLYYIRLLRMWWKKMVVVVFVFMFLAMISSLRAPISYVSTVTLISSGGPVSSIGSPLVSLLGLGGGKSGQFASGAGDVPVAALLSSKRMARDISNKFGLDKKPDFSYNLSRGKVREADSIVVTGTDPGLTRDIANFVVENLDNLNTELKLSSQKPILTILDPAETGTAVARNTKRGMLVAGILGFLLTCFCAVFVDYLKKLKDTHETQKA